MTRQTTGRPNKGGVRRKKKKGRNGGTRKFGKSKGLLPKSARFLYKGHGLNRGGDKKKICPYESLDTGRKPCEGAWPKNSGKQGPLKEREKTARSSPHTKVHTEGKGFHSYPLPLDQICGGFGGK